MSLYVDAAAWRRFRKLVFTKYGTLRKLSDEVEALISSEDTEEAIVAGAKKLGVTIDRGLIPAQIKKIRPKLQGELAEALVRQMRNQRHGGRLSRH